MFPHPDPVPVAALAILGAVVGSFLATLAVRWPEDRSALRGRSACDGCGRTLTARELVPLLSALATRGRCRTCGATIDPRHWRIEAAAATVGALAGLAAPWPEAAAGAVFGWLLLALAAIDLTDFWLPDELNVTLTLTGLAAALVVPVPSLTDRLIGAAAGFVALWTIAALWGALRGREVMGGGDPKLLCGIGAWLGWAALPNVLLLASGLGLAMALAARMRGREVGWTSEVPFGAFLAVAAYPAWLAMVAFRA